ncbi:PTS sugar transporter subunit IIA [Anaerostipes butyraticus]|uniref:PTS sugar transporter subunit IIA n=1 Tax=Anaerostipes butyraticus TaxID=645466 RepID=UPI0023A8D43D|nr:PTS sugar transporter subunit IIA [Anaerostipes butyraticus]
MIWEDLNENLIMPDLKAGSSDEVFQQLGGLLVSEGYCKSSYVQALIEREKDFPTGINMGNIGIAIPHTDKEHVIKGAVAIGVLKEPVHFYQMGTNDENVEAKLIFMLAVKDPKEHLVFLQRILMVLQDQEVLKQLIETKNKQEIINIIKEKEEQL